MSQEIFRWLHFSIWVFRNWLSSFVSFFSLPFFTAHIPYLLFLCFSMLQDHPPCLAGHRSTGLQYGQDLFSFFTLGSELSDTWSYSLVTSDSVSKCIDIFGEKSSALHLFPRKFRGWDDQLCFLLSSDQFSSGFSFFPPTALTWHISLQL